jgi:hypothetical protein
MSTENSDQKAFEYQKIAAERAHDRHFQSLKDVTDGARKAGEVAIRGLLLVNGGAAVAILAFAGGLASQNRIPMGSLVDLSSSLVAFACGVGTAVLALGAAYFTNYASAIAHSFYEFHYPHPFVRGTQRSQRWERMAAGFQWAAVIFSFFSLLLFFLGIFEVRQSVTKISSPATTEQSQQPLSPTKN